MARPVFRLIPATVLLAACGGAPEPEPEAPAAAADPAGAPEAPADKAKAKARPPKGKDKDEINEVRGKGPGLIHWQRPGSRTHTSIDALPEGAPALVVLVILDTVRADHMQLCGYDRPNTPFMAKVAEKATAWSCDAYSPATWTLPAHASYFTGRSTADHGVHTLGTPLGDDFETLAEIYAARGYQTMFVSANPVFGKEEGGFWQGFDRVVVAEGLRGPLRQELAKHLKAEFERLDADAPLFLTINIFDAHDPYPEIPAGLGWVDKMERFSLRPHTADPKNPYYRFVTGAMAEEEKPAYLAQIRDAYDHGVYAADQNLGVLIKGLVNTGWMARPHRIAITSDHGEHLGEHGLLRHGSATWQTVTRVPFLYLDSAHASLDLPSPVSATTAFDLLKDGALPTPPRLVESASARNPEDFKPSWETVSVWPSNGEKLTWWEGDDRRYDLQADPMEENATPVPARHAFKPKLDARVAAHEASVAAALERAQDPAVMELMKAVGYVQDE